MNVYGRISIYKNIIDKLSISKEDLTITELQIIEISFNIIKDRLSDMQFLQEENNRLSIENTNLESYRDDNDYE